MIIAGVHKAGTTSLYSYLARHPQVCPSFKKEIGYFYPLLHDRRLAGIDEYARHFAHCGKESFRMEASPSYLYGKEKIAESVRQTIPDARIVIILRDPTDRLVSYYSRAAAESEIPDNITFSDYVNASVEQQTRSERNPYVRGFREGLYIDYIRTWHDVFGNNLKVVFFEDLRDHALELTGNICAWLRLDSSCYDAGEFTVENKTLKYRHVTLHRYVKGVYMKNEAFWRKNSRLKQGLRGIYNLLNAESGRAPGRVDNETISRLRKLYEPHNRELARFLKANNHNSLPAWLQEH